MVTMSKHMAYSPSIIGNTLLLGMAIVVKIIFTSVKLLGMPLKAPSRIGSRMKVQAILGAIGQHQIGTRSSRGATSSTTASKLTLELRSARTAWKAVAARSG